MTGKCQRCGEEDKLQAGICVRCYDPNKYPFVKTPTLRERRDGFFSAVRTYLALIEDREFPLIEGDLLDVSRELASIGAELLRRRPADAYGRERMMGFID